VTVNRTRPAGTSPTAQPPLGWPAEDPPEAEGTRRVGLAVAGLALLTAAVLCVAAFLVLRIFFPGSLSALLPSLGEGTLAPTPSGVASPAASPASGQATLRVNPAQGTLGTLVTASGEGWLPGEAVFVFLRSPDDPAGQGQSYAAALADTSGLFQAAFTFPQDPRWAREPWADVIARGSRSGREASAQFSLLLPTATTTQIPTVLPVWTPTTTPAPSPSATPTATPTPVVIITEWRGEYFANPALSGSPALVRNDRDINFDWGPGAPAAGLPADGFSARWTRLVSFHAGTYRFTVGADDGVRVWVDGQLAVDEWRDGGFQPHSFDVELPQGEHALQVEYYENLGSARVLLAWEALAPTATPAPTGTPTPTATATAEPTDTPSPTPTSPAPQLGPWVGQYYDNPALQGDPALIREDPVLAFNWGAGPPHEGMKADHFSARWATGVWLVGGTYRFVVDYDDGVRVWLDDGTLIDDWRTTGGATRSADFQVTDGVHQIKVEYFEDQSDARIRCALEALP
jgi:hypothetical protein